MKDVKGISRILFASLIASQVSLLGQTTSATTSNEKSELTPEQSREQNIRKLEASGKTVIKVEDLPPAIQTFLKLDDDQKQAYSEHFDKAQRYFQQQRIIESLQELKKAEKIHRNHPNLLNLQGSCHVHLRDFGKAEKVFKEALTSQPNSPNLLFNIAEMHFVTKQWQTCLSKLTELNKLLPEENKTSRSLKRLVEFKRLLCLISLNRMKEAEAIRDQYDIWDDSPIHYYSQASIEYKKENKIEADRWLVRARRVFRQNGALSGWDDTLTEYGYIKSFYGDGTLE